jgi:hypothetical protein
MEALKKRCIILFGAAMYLSESPLVLRLMDLAFDVNNKEMDIKEIDEIEEYVCQQVTIKINNDELKRVIFRDDKQ